jgi:hypothetical protein
MQNQIAQYAVTLKITANFRRPPARRAAADGVSQAKTTFFAWRSY